MKLQTYINKLTITRKRKIVSVIRYISDRNITGQNLIENLFRESCLNKNDWDELFNAIFLAKKDYYKIMNTIQSFCRSGRLLIGNHAQISSTIILARVRSFERFCEDLRRLKYYNDIEEAKADVSFKLGLDPKDFLDDWKEQAISEFTMWSTFDPSGDDPFGNSIPPSKELLCSLGLEPSMDLALVFYYLLSPSDYPRIPTCCDAYAGTWSKYFHRVSPKSPFGFTQPAEDCPGISGRPEVVHLPIKGKHLIAPITRCA